ncbi:MAG: hypothetical protein ABIR31_07220 [Ginsengibacter sp.]
MIYNKDELIGNRLVLPPIPKVQLNNWPADYKFYSAKLYKTDKDEFKLFTDFMDKL